LTGSWLCWQLGASPGSKLFQLGLDNDTNVIISMYVVEHGGCNPLINDDTPLLRLMVNRRPN
jgi:hypothetical protein